MTHGLVSTIMPIFNRPQQLREAVGSTSGQDNRPIEILIVNDGDEGRTEVAEALAGAMALRLAADARLLRSWQEWLCIPARPFRLQELCLAADPAGVVAPALSAALK